MTLSLAEWHDSTRHPSVRIRADVKVSLDSLNQARAAHYQKVRRAARLDEAISQDRVAFLRTFVLKDPSMARLWWLDRNLSSAEPDTSWARFDAVVNPLVAHAGAQEELATRISQIMVSTLDRISEGPDGLWKFGQAAAVALEVIGWPDLAEEIKNPNGKGRIEATEAPPTTPAA